MAVGWRLPSHTRTHTHTHTSRPLPRRRRPADAPPLGTRRDPPLSRERRRRAHALLLSPAAFLFCTWLLPHRRPAGTATWTSPPSRRGAGSGRRAGMPQSSGGGERSRFPEIARDRTRLHEIARDCTRLHAIARDRPRSREIARDSPHVERRGVHTPVHLADH